MAIKARIEPYTCKHFKWECWWHYGMAMPEGGCKLTDDIFACKVWDAADCEKYESKESDTT